MRKIILITFFVCASNVLAQEIDSTLYRWMPNLSAGVNLSQISLNNWIKGGESSLSWTITTDFNLNYKTTFWTFSNELKLAYGRTKLGSQSFRTNDNELFNESVLKYKRGKSVQMFFSNTLRTQITEGFDYGVEPSLKIANIFDPGYLTQSIGASYSESKVFQTRIGVAIQEVFTNRFTQYSDDPETLQEFEKFKFESGVESVTDLDLPLDDNLVLKSKLRLFTRFNRLDVWDVRFDNTITAKVNSWLNVNLVFLLIYEKDQSPKTQIKEALQIGLVYTLL